MTPPTPPPPPAENNSRATAEQAGWGPPEYDDPTWVEMLESRKRNRWGNFSWISPAPLLASANDLLAKGMDDLINSIRPRWVAEQRARGMADRNMRLAPPGIEGDFSFLILGDPGEQDASQYAVVKPLLQEGGGTAFMIVNSDVIYPAGDVNDYLDGFYLPYADYQAPIYAIPGNHDWYDGLNGFMWNFCDAEALPPIKYRAGGFSWRERLARSLWRKPSPPKLPQLLHAREQLPERRRNATQPGPYFAIRSETHNLVIVCIDTGITGTLDREQGDWLCRVSGWPGRKVLITGKPIYVDGEYHPGRIDWGPEDDGDIKNWVDEHFETVDDVVRHPNHNYVAAIGGDIHNYQRYSVTVNQPSNEEQRVIEYIVAGGGGAYLSATHAIPKVDLQPKKTKRNLLLGQQEEKEVPVERVTENDFWCYPLRGDSLARFVRRSTIGIQSTLLAGIAGIAAAAYLLWGQGLWDDEIQKFSVEYPDEGGGELWKALLTVPGTLIAAAIALAGMLISKSLVPKGYRTMSGTVLTVAIGALLVWGVNELVLDWDNLVWKMALATLMAIAIPVFAVAGYYLLRDFIAPSVRVAIALGAPLALALGLVLVLDLVKSEEASFVVGVSLLALWAGVAVVGRLRSPKDPEKHKVLLRIGRLVPLFLAVAAVITALAIVGGNGWSWIPIGLAVAFAGILILAALTVLGLGLFRLPALWWLGRIHIDPDETARWLGDRIRVEPVRSAANGKRVSLKTRALAGLVYRTPLRKPIAELAEATEAPFFKSFLKADVRKDELVLTCFGVTGHYSDQESPTVEDRVTVKLV